MSDDVDGAGKGLKSSALLVAAVFAVLVAGWILKSPPSAAPEPAAALPSVLPPALGTSIVPEPVPPAPSQAVDEQSAPPPADEAPAFLAEPAPAPADPVLTKLATRASSDAARLSRAKGRYTAQLLVACKPATVDRLLSASAGSTKLYILPAQVKDDPCFRVCYGDYATAKDAAAAADLPKALRGTDRIGAVEIEKVIR